MPKKKKTDKANQVDKTQPDQVEVELEVESVAQEDRAKLEADYKELEDRWLRLQAEYDNYRRRSSQELARRYDDALVDVCTAWLEVMDNLDRAELAAAEVVSEEGKRLAEGVVLVKRQAQETLAKFGIEEIPTLGEQFDPKWHEALHHIESSDHKENEISQSFEKGYRKGDRVLRHAKVQVAN